MAKRDRLFQDRSITIDINDVVIEYLEDLAKTGLYGNTHQEAAEIVFRRGLQSLIDANVVKVKDRAFSKDGED